MHADQVSERAYNGLSEMETAFPGSNQRSVIMLRDYEGIPMRYYLHYRFIGIR
jgi:hypothetical protein